MAPQTVGGYEVIRSLGAGGMGEVLLARDPRLERMVALKVLHRDFAVDPTARKRFHREAKALASLSHPGIVTIHEIGEDQDRDFIVMEFLRGRNLRSHVIAGKLSQAEKLALTKQIAEAIAGAHGAGVLHRDIKPENIMVDDDQAIKVVDFGLAKSFNEIESGQLPHIDTLIDVMASTMQVGVDPRSDAFAQDTVPAPTGLSAATETILGTPGYMAPELFVGETPTAASDVYSLGVLLYEIIAGELPFRADSLDALLQLRVYDDAEAVRLDEGAGVPTDVADLVSDMLKKDPELRPSISAVVERIAAAQDAATQKIRALENRPPAGRALSQEIDVFPARRRRRAAKAASVVTLSAALAAGVFVFRSNDEASTKTKTQEPAIQLASKSIRVAVAPFEAILLSYAAANTGVAQSAATVLKTFLNRADPILAMAPGQLSTIAGIKLETRDDWNGAALLGGAEYIVRATLSEDQGLYAGSVEITNLLDRRVETFSTKASSANDLDGVLLDLANLIATKVAPGNAIVASPKDSKRSIESLALYDQALGALYANRWAPACVLLESIVKEQPTFFEAWYHLAMASAWAARPAAEAMHAAETALALATTKRDRDLMKVLILHYQRNQAAASKLGKQLAEEFPRDPDIAYAYAETVYHDGRYREALELFEAALKRAPRSHLASAHPLQHAAANGHLAKWQHYQALRGSNVHQATPDNTPTPQLLIGEKKYSAVLETNTSTWRMQAFSLLQQDDKARAEMPAEGELKGDFLTYALARSVEEGRLDEAKTYFARVWKTTSDNARAAGNHLKIMPIAELLIAGELKEEFNTFLGYWDLEGVQKEGTEESQIRAFAAILLEDETMIPRDGFPTWRDAKQAEALRAEFAGEHSLAVEIWQDLLQDPSQWGDYLERLALARNLHALGNTSELKKACTDIVHPRVWRPAHAVMRMQCRRWAALPRSKAPGF